jgi:dihydrofolate reductase
MLVSLIVAAAENYVIGKDGKLPWNLPNDLKYFRDLTIGKPVIMGRKTYASIGHALPNRENVVVTRQPHLHLSDATVVHSLEEALHYAKEQVGAKETFVIGGGEIFREALPSADRIYLTRVAGVFEGDAFFPDLPEGEWHEVSREEHAEDARHLRAYTFLVYERK